MGYSFLCLLTVNVCFCRAGFHFFSSKPRQWLGKHLRNDVFVFNSVEWDIKLVTCSLTQCSRQKIYKHILPHPQVCSPDHLHWVCVQIIWVVGCWRGYLSGARCRDRTASWLKCTQYTNTCTQASQGRVITEAVNMAGSKPPHDKYRL